MSVQCTSVGPLCPIQASDYGYWPSLPANAFFAAIFGACAVIQIIAGMRWRAWTFMIAVAMGCTVECIGYVGRILLSKNPFDGNGNKIQIVCLIFAPSFLAAGVYLTLKHLVITIGPQFSLLKPKYYTWIFISSDIISLLLQVAGGALTATATDANTQRTGSHIMLSGIVFQVLTLLVFAILASAYFRRVFSSSDQLSAAAAAMLRDSRFRFFVVADLIAYCAILSRCIYRIPELAVGWRGAVFQNQGGFIAMESVMIATAALCQTIFHPGYWFPAMQNSRRVTVDMAVDEKPVGSRGSNFEETPRQCFEQEA